MSDRSGQLSQCCHPCDMGQFGLCFLQRFFGLLLFGAVYDNRREKRGVASTCGDEDRADVGPHYTAIFAQEALLEMISSSPPFVCLRYTGFCGGTVLGMGDVQSGTSLEFVLSIAEHFLKSQVCRDEAAVRSNQCNAD